MRPLASRMSRLGTETAFEVLAKARALEAKGRDIVHLEIGEPDFDTPPAIVAAGVAALERGETHYTPSAGVVELREAITLYLKERRGDRKSTRLNSSHRCISYAVFCLKKKK